MADPKGFLKNPRETPLTRPIQERVRDWNEIYLEQSEAKTRTQGARCMDCGVPFCQSPVGCPVENIIPDWNDLAHRGRWKEALKVLHATNNFTEFTGRLCPAPCESACVLGINDDPVTIRVLESSIIDRGFAEGWVEPILPVVETGRRVAIIGSGPSGLAAAQQLRRAGHGVTIFEKSDRAGGLLRYGIPDFKLEKRILDRRLAQLEAEGVAFRFGIEVGAHLTLHDLRQSFDAVCITIGAERPRDLNVPGRSLEGIVYAMDFLSAQNRRTTKRPVTHDAHLTAHGKDVVIIGGGDTGADCLGTVLRQGCQSVAQIEILPKPPSERDSSTPWPLWPLK
ncbi:MAG: glutamate synthase subunit beta, partial [Bdellovibrionota bacterium]